MKINTIGKIFLFLVLAMLTSYMAVAAINVNGFTVDIKPADPKSTDKLICGWIIDADLAAYKANVTWFKNGGSYTSDDENNIDTDNKVEKTTGTQGNVEAFDTIINEKWKCRVTLGKVDGSESLAPKDSNEVTIKNQIPTLQSLSSVNIQEDAGNTLIGDISSKATDADGTDKDKLTFEISLQDTNQVSCSITTDGKELRVNPAANFFVTSKCTVKVKDNFNGEAKQEFSITVNAVNDKSTITSTAKTTAVVNETYSYDLEASDVDLDALTYSLEIKPTGMTISSTTGLISFKSETEGTFPVKVLVSDGKGETAFQQFDLIISKSAPAAPTSSKYLKIKEIKFYIDNKKDKDIDETGGTANDVSPGSKIRIRVDVENLWPSSDKDHQINDVEVEVELDDMGGDTNSQDDTLSYKDLDPGDDDSDETTFNIDNDAEEGTYDLKLTLTGTDDFDNTKYEVNKTVNVRIRKESHDVDFTKFELSPSTVSCTRTAKLSLRVTNLGRNDEDIQYVLKANKELGIEEKIELTKLIEGDVGDEETYISKEYTFNIPTNVKPGSYSVESEVYFDDDQGKNSKSAILVVADCGSAFSNAFPVVNGNTQSSQPAQQPEKKTNVEVVSTSNTQGQTPITTPTVAVTTLPAGQSVFGFLGSSGYVVLLVIAIIVVLLVIIFLLVAIARSGRRN